MRSTYLGFAALSLAACVFDAGGVGNGGIGDDDAGIDGGVPDAGEDCTPAQQTCVDEGTLRSCEGGSFVDRTCPLGCLDTPGVARCALPVPSNQVDVAWADDPEVVADLVIATGETFVFETHTGRLQKCGGGEFHDTNIGVKNGINYQQLPSMGPPTLGVLALRSLSIQPGGTLRVIGDVPGAILLRNDLTIAGTLDLSGGAGACDLNAACGQLKELWCPGPGGGKGGVGTAPGGVSAGAPGDGDGGGGGGTFGGVGIDEIGGAGGGFGGTGGAPGGLSLVAGGATYGATELEPLLGGSGGGAGGFSSGSGGDGGGGAGALQLTAGIEITIAQGGAIVAGGGGGGASTGMQGNGGGGGGSGGAVLIEAPAVHIDGAVAANGGGGGGGGDPAKPGQNGQANAVGAAGGEGLNATRNGGTGGAGGLIAGAQGNPMGVAGDGTGGGGGGVGRVFLRGLAGGIDVAGGVVSPAPGPGPLKTK